MRSSSASGRSWGRGRNADPRAPATVAPAARAGGSYEVFSVFWPDQAPARVFFRTAPAGSHRLPPPHAVHLHVLGRPDLAAELLDLGRQLGGPLEEAVGLGEQLVLD